MVTNSRGDVVGIVNGNGVMIVNYEYDAWGNVLSVTDQNGAAITSSGHLGNLNSLRYRGYYYDTDLGMYYLQSRYYDPEVRRFINADDVSVLEEDQGSIIENNLYTYCLNNSVNMLDDSGEVAWWIGAAVSGAAFNVGVYLVTCAVKGKKISWKTVGKEALIGAVYGVAFGALGKTVKSVRTSVRAKKTLKYTSGTSNQVGKIGEKISGIVKNTRKYRINGRVRIPDGITKRYVQEVKNVKSLSLTQQLRDYIELSERLGKRLQLYIRPDTKLSKPLKQAIKKYKIKVKYLW